MAATAVRASFERRKGRAETNVVRGTVLLEGGVVQLFIGRSRQLLCRAKEAGDRDVPSGFLEFELPRGKIAMPERSWPMRRRRYNF